MEDKKYELLKDDYIKFIGVKLYRIRALKNFKGILKGTIGGYIKKEENLSQKDNCWVFENAKVFGNARVFEYAEVRGCARVFGNAKVFENAVVCGYAVVRGYARVFGNAEVCGNVAVCGNPTISNKTDYIVFKNNWSSGRYFIWTRSNDMWSVGCFYGNGKELIEKAYKDSKLSGDMYKMYVEFVEKIKERLKEKGE